MTALTEFLFPAPARRSGPAILRWWESRRLVYNLIVGAAGLVSLGLFHTLLTLPPGAHRVGMMWQPVLVFGVLANVCYLLGPVAEIGIEKLSGGRVLPVGPALYRMGLTFSVGLAFLPTLMAGFDWVYRILHALI